MVENVDLDGKKYDNGTSTSYFFVSFHFIFFKDQSTL